MISHFIHDCTNTHIFPCQIWISSFKSEYKVKGISSIQFGRSFFRFVFAQNISAPLIFSCLTDWLPSLCFLWNSICQLTLVFPFYIFLRKSPSPALLVEQKHSELGERKRRCSQKKESRTGTGWLTLRSSPTSIQLTFVQTRTYGPTSIQYPHYATGYIKVHHLQVEQV